jgi:hypothetical protein
MFGPFKAYLSNTATTSVGRLKYLLSNQDGVAQQILSWINMGIISQPFDIYYKFVSKKQFKVFFFSFGFPICFTALSKERIPKQITFEISTTNGVRLLERYSCMFAIMSFSSYYYLLIFFFFFLNKQKSRKISIAILFCLGAVSITSVGNKASDAIVEDQIIHS